MSTKHDGTSAWAPLRKPLFAALWGASVVSNIGTWIHDIGATWLMAEKAPSPLLIALMQTAASLPMFLLALPSGAIADVLDRRRLLLLTQAWMLVSAAALAALTLAGLATPWILLTLTFTLSMGAALNMPAWQAILPELVSWPELPAAIALNSVAFNLARAVGPFLGGLLFDAVGPGFSFLLNAVSFIGVILVLYGWRRVPRESVLPAERIVGAMRAGLRYVRHAPSLQAVLVRCGIFVFCGSSIWSLLPYVSKEELGLDSVQFGILQGCLGLGAVLGAFLLPSLRRRASLELLVAGAMVLFALTAVGLAFLHHFLLLCPVLIVGGVAWMAFMSSMNVTAQTLVPAWVRARALAVYLLAFTGGMAAGPPLWGALVNHHGTAFALVCSAVGMVAGLAAVGRFPLASGEPLDLTPSLHWGDPVVAVELHPDQGPVLVTVEYLIDPQRAADFAVAMHDVSRIRRRDGAFYWGLFQDVAAPGRFVEHFAVESWAEHLRQHERVTAADRVFEERALAFHRGDKPPVVFHYLAQPVSTRLARQVI